MSVINEILLIVGILANYGTTVSLVTFKQDKSHKRKLWFSAMAWFIACLTLWAGSHTLRMLVDGHPFNGVFYAILSVAICAISIECRGNVSRALKGSSYVESD